jgi:hypothetical protein
MFYNCFAMKEKENSYKSSMIPSTGFFSSYVNVTSMFENCGNLHGELYQKNLWWSNTVTWSSSNAFSGCLKMPQWRYIPLEWGGRRRKKCIYI